jgi:hypothetical protein
MLKPRQHQPRQANGAVSDSWAFLPLDFLADAIVSGSIRSWLDPDNDYGIV